MDKRTILILVCSLSLLIRFLFIPNPGFEADVAFWKGWGLAAADKGVVWSLLNTNNNYPSPFSYTLGGMVVLYRWLGGNPYDFNDYWNHSNTRFLFVSKLPAIIADFGIALVFLWIGRHAKKFHLPESDSLYLILATMYLLSPVSIMDGAWWGQVDSLGVVYFLLVILALLYKRTFLAGLIFMFAMMTKLQNMIYGPLLFVFIWKEFGFQGMLRALMGAVTGFFGFNIEFFLSKNMSRVVDSLVNNYDYFPWMSLHAYNPWWVVAKGQGMQMSDKYLSIGLLTAKSVGTILFATSYLLAVLQLVLTDLEKIFLPLKKPLEEKKHSPSPESIFHFFLGLTIVNLGFFLFQTQSHDRYAFPATVFSLFLIPFLKGKKRTLFIAGYIVCSIVYFLNLHTAFAANYPTNVWQFLLWMNAPGPSMAIAIFQTIAFFVLVLFFFKSLSAKALGISVLFCLALVAMGNKNLVLKKPMLLGNLTPIISSQGYGLREKDMPVNSSFGPKSWTFLSDQYVFYRHGIGTHANSEITYDIGGHFQQIQTDYGIDTTAGTQASAIFEIYGDGQKLFESTKMGRFDMPKHVELNLTGVKFLTLKTNDAGDSNRDDHTDWLNTKIIPK